MSDWDASKYHRISEPQFEWGQRVLARLEAGPDERILDLGCGTGRLTTQIAASVPRGRVVGLDRSGAMLAVARASRDERVRPAAYVQADGAAVPFAHAFDAVFSAATLHWIPDHQRVFDSVRDALRPGGRFIAQCGGAGNLHRLLERADRLMREPEYARTSKGGGIPGTSPMPASPPSACTRPDSSPSRRGSRVRRCTSAIRRPLASSSPWSAFAIIWIACPCSIASRSRARSRARSETTTRRSCWITSGSISRRGRRRDDRAIRAAGRGGRQRSVTSSSGCRSASRGPGWRRSCRVRA